MKLVVFGLTVSSSWGNGHATLWRGLCRALARRGHRVVFFEKDAPYYAGHRDCHALPGGGDLHVYGSWQEIAPLARREIADTDVAMVTSYCPDALAATDLVLDSPAPVRVFYDLDSGVTLERIARGEPVPYVGARGLEDFDLTLSYTGGRAVTELRHRLGARRVVPLYGHVDPDIHRPVRSTPRYGCDLSYLGTYAPDRQALLKALFLAPARALPERRFIIGGSMYPAEFPWTPNIWYLAHVPPGDHPAFYSSSRLTLNVTRAAMAAMGYCPSGRYFEAAACGTPLISDWWEGLDHFFSPGSEVIVARDTGDAVAALELSDGELGAIARAARERTLAEHTADRRALELERALEEAVRPLAGARELPWSAGAPSPGAH